MRQQMAVDREYNSARLSGFLCPQVQCVVTCVWYLDHARSSQESQHGLVVLPGDFDDWWNLCA